MASYEFPTAFIFGAATAAYQIEGATTEGGRSPSVWDVFARIPGRVKTGETGDRACDHYHRMAADVALMASLGIRHYRFSIAWPRIIPNGRGPVNEVGLDFYRRLLDELERHGITPHATLFHWDSPQILDEMYGTWRSRRIADDFAEYAAVVVSRLGDRIRNWMTLNEIPSFTHFGYGVSKPGIQAPGGTVTTVREQWQTSHHALLAHGKAVQAIRAHSKNPCSIALADNGWTTVPMTESESDIAASAKAYRNLWFNGGILFPVLTGRYSEEFVRDKEKRGEIPEIREGDLDIISQPIDAIGRNVYNGTYCRAADNADGFELLDFPKGYPKLDMPWLQLVPDALYWDVRHLCEQTGFKGKVYITENGCAAADEISPAGDIVDTDRILYLRTNLRQAHRAIDEGFPLSGYFVWSLMDNYEWTWGYSRRFGIVYTNFETQQRIPKASAHWYHECIRQHRVV